VALCSGDGHLNGLNLKRTGTASYEPAWQTNRLFLEEIAHDPVMPTYSGGLGILAGDSLRAAAEEAPK